MTTALHLRHRYRRSRIGPRSGGAPTAAGPKICRSTNPWPTSTIGPPIGCEAAEQHGHLPGRASPQVGGAACQDLTPSGLATNLLGLRGSLT